MNKSRLVLGSMAGALAIHVALVACSSMGTPPDAGLDGGVDVAGSDVVPGTDVVSSDGLIDAMRDGIAEAAADVLAMETSSADAQGMDGGTTTCTCPTLPAPPDYSFSLLDNGAPPRTDDTTATVSVVRVPREAFPGESASPYQVQALATFWVPNPGGGVSQQQLFCTAYVRPDLSIIGGNGACGFNAAGSPTGGGASVEASVTVLTETQVELHVRRFATASHDFTGIIFRGNVPGAHFRTPPSAYRP